jgi:hypothetical protein
LLAVPSFSTLQSLRKSIIECGNTCPLTQKHLVQLDWVSKEDGSHILTVAVGSKVNKFAVNLQMNGLVFKFKRLVYENDEYVFEQQTDKMMK